MRPLTGEQSSDIFSEHLYNAKESVTSGGNVFHDARGKVDLSFDIFGNRLQSWSLGPQDIHHHANCFL